jgi:hypothetical protein
MREELLLASALKRQDTGSWDSVAMEMQRFTPSGCRRQALVLHLWCRQLWTPPSPSGWRSCRMRCGGWGRGGAPSEQNLEPKEQVGAAFLYCC